MNPTEITMADALAARSTSAILLDTLREDIVHGRLKPGERVMQDAVATRFGVSHTVAREAFRDLVQEGFLMAEPRRGVSVASMSAEEADEITQLRSRIEPQALAWAIPRMTAAVIDAAEKTLKELDKARSVNQIILLNARFHQILYAPAARARTLAMVETLRLGFERYLRFTWESTSHLERSQKEHVELLRLCRAGAVDKACEMLRKHITATGTQLIDSLLARGNA